MNKYRVKTKRIEYYQELEIEAQNEEEAKEKYQTMLEGCGVRVVSSDFMEIEVSKV